MIVMMKRDIAPLCDRHHSPMQLAQFGASNIALTFIAYKCLDDSCSRAYQHGSGYVDITDFVSFENGLRRDCPEDDTTMYLAEIDPNGIQIWRCGQVSCVYSEAVNPHERFRVMVRPIEVRDQEPAERKPYAQLEAVGISNGGRWIGPCQAWDVMLVVLSSFGQNSAQLVGVRNSLLDGTPAELVGRVAPLGVTEQQLMKAGLRRLRTEGIAIAS